MTAQRKLSRFDSDYYHYEGNRHLYKNIKPNHGAGNWMIEVCRQSFRADTLVEAVRVRDREQANG
jgi:hypothetical protein